MKELKTAEEVLADKCQDLVQAFIDNPGLHAAVLEAMQAYAAQEKRWISVEEPPKKDCEVLALCDDKQYVLWFSGDKFYMDFRPTKYFKDWTEYVTHWQPLPPKP